MPPLTPSAPFQTDRANLARDARGLADARACEEIVTAFMDHLDDGDLDAAFAHHADDVEFWAPGATEPTRTKAEALAGAARFRFPYPERVTIHAVTNFISRSLSADELEAQYQVTVYELTDATDGAVRRLPAPRIQLIARERTRFRRDAGGRWWIAEQHMVPFGTPGAQS